jgi:tricorn protease
VKRSHSPMPASLPARALLVLAIIALAGLAGGATLAAASTAASSPSTPPDGPARLLRYADVSDRNIVFTYEDDLWLVPIEGGLARRLTVGHGAERGARFSPDGRWIAFTGQYDGGYDVYVMPTEGGEPVRLTYHPGYDQVLDWHPDGERILFRSSRQNPTGEPELYLVPRTGGLPQKVAVDRGALASYSPDGSRIAYNRIPREARTWKRYQGGMAQDIWLGDFEAGTYRKLTDWPGTDNFPMWVGDKIYFTSDREDGTLNIYALDPASGNTERLTSYKDYDVKYPSSGPDKIVFQYGEALQLLDLQTGKVSPVDVQVRSDRLPMRTERVEISPRTGSFSLSPAGERLLLEARGEIINLPAEEGAWFDLTHRSASREKDAAWSPDGSQICLISDRTGEEQLYLVDQEGKGDWRQVTDRQGEFLLPPVWSPDGKWILFGDKSMRLNLLEVASGKLKTIDQGKYDDAWERWGILDYVWSPDSRWVAYSKNTGNMHEVICLYSLDSGKTTQVTDNFFASWSPSFDPQGRYLWFLSNRTFEPIMGRVDETDVFLKMGLPYLVLLKDGERSPFFEGAGLVAAGKDDQSAKGDKADKKGAKKKDKEKEGDAEGEGATPVQIDLAGIGERILPAEGMEPGNVFRLTATDDGCLLLRRDEPVFLKYQNVDDRTSESDLALVKYAIGDKESEDLASGLANYHLSADGKKLVYRAGSRYGVVDAGTSFKPGDGAVDLDGVRITVDRDAEYRQIFNEAWRVQRDWFYDPGMHGVDWPAIRAKYERFLPWVGMRGDLTYLIGEMISELNIGHTYVYGGDRQGDSPNIPTGLLGCDLALDTDSGRYRIAHIVPGVSWDEHLRSPLDEPGVDVSEGDYLLAVDGVELKADENPYAQLVDKAGRLVELTVGPRADGKDSRQVLVETLRYEGLLRYYEWVEDNRRYVDEHSGGKIGYLHLPNMMEPGLIMFAKYWYPQYDKQAFIIDERYNGGGFVGDMIIDRLERQLWAITVPREGGPARNPERDFHGPMAVLINEDTGSNGEYFAYAIQAKKLATLIGKRTWGGAVGIEAHEDLVDGGVTTPPQFGIYGLDGKWIIEGHGVDPDIEVQNEPAEVLAGHDQQLDAAIAHLQDRLETEGQRWAIPERPPYPDKSKPGEGVAR